MATTLLRQTIGHISKPNPGKSNYATDGVAAADAAAVQLLILPQVFPGTRFAFVMSSEDLREGGENNGLPFVHFLGGKLHRPSASASVSASASAEVRPRIIEH